MMDLATMFQYGHEMYLSSPFDSVDEAVGSLIMEAWCTRDTPDEAVEWLETKLKKAEGAFYLVLSEAISDIRGEHNESTGI